MGAANVEWVWCPNILSVPGGAANGMHRYYPGQEYVDWVALDGYNWGDDHDEWHRWQSFEEVYHAGLEELAGRYPGKPIMIGEMGCPPGRPGQKAAWIRNAHRALAHHPGVKAVIWFNYDKRAEGEPNWRIDTSAEALQAFNETFAAPQPAGRTWPAPIRQGPGVPTPGGARRAPPGAANRGRTAGRR